jgi:TATA-binding protein-associated factor Taf7
MKTEKTVEVVFSKEEDSEYKKLEDAALSFYSNFKAKRAKKLSKYFLKLSAKLSPMRIACSGGRVPLDDTDAELDADENSDGEENDNVNGGGEEENEQESDPLKEDENGEENPEGDDDVDDDDDGDDEEAEQKDEPKKKRKEVNYSKFVFRSKFAKLIQELKHARDNDPSCTCPVSVCCCCCCCCHALWRRPYFKLLNFPNLLFLRRSQITDLQPIY